MGNKWFEKAGIYGGGNLAPHLSGVMKYEEPRKFREKKKLKGEPTIAYKVAKYI